MTVEDLPVHYWDANVFLSLINEYEERAPDIEEMLNQAAQDKLRIITSTVTVAEVAHAAHEGVSGVLDTETESRINALWDPPSPVKLVEFHRGIAETARGLMRKGKELGLSLKPLDAIHLATAVTHAVSELNTYDDPLKRYAGMSGIKICSPVPTQRILNLPKPTGESPYKDPPTPLAPPPA